MVHIENFSKTCPYCSTEEERHYCDHCRGTGLMKKYYRRTCNYKSRNECEWGGDCKYCPNSEPIPDNELRFYFLDETF